VAPALDLTRSFVEPSNTEIDLLRAQKTTNMEEQRGRLGEYRPAVPTAAAAVQGHPQQQQDRRTRAAPPPDDVVVRFRDILRTTGAAIQEASERTWSTEMETKLSDQLYTLRLVLSEVRSYNVKCKKEVVPHADVVTAHLCEMLVRYLKRHASDSEEEGGGGGLRALANILYCAREVLEIVDAPAKFHSALEMIVDCGDSKNKISWLDEFLARGGGGDDDANIVSAILALPKLFDAACSDRTVQHRIKRRRTPYSAIDRFPPDEKWVIVHAYFVCHLARTELAGFPLTLDEWKDRIRSMLDRTLRNRQSVDSAIAVYMVDWWVQSNDQNDGLPTDMTLASVLDGLIIVGTSCK
jgi:hypothetical protein